MSTRQNDFIIKEDSVCHSASTIGRTLFSGFQRNNYNDKSMSNIKKKQEKILGNKKIEIKKRFHLTCKYRQ